MRSLKFFLIFVLLLPRLSSGSANIMECRMSNEEWVGSISLDAAGAGLLQFSQKSTGREFSCPLILKYLGDNIMGVVPIISLDFRRDYCNPKDSRVSSEVFSDISLVFRFLGERPQGDVQWLRKFQIDECEDVKIEMPKVRLRAEKWAQGTWGGPIGLGPMQEVQTISMFSVQEGGDSQDTGKGGLFSQVLAKAMQESDTFVEAFRKSAKEVRVVSAGAMTPELVMDSWAPVALRPSRDEERRVAFIAGNSNYEWLSRLSVDHDVAALGRVLDDLQFEVTVVEDADITTLLNALLAFSSESAQADVVLVYLGGFGGLIDGEDYFGGVAMKWEGDELMDSVSLSSVLEIAREALANNGVLVSIYDASRTSYSSSAGR